jgi:hypothetical protein
MLTFIVRTDGSRRQVDDADARLVLTQQGIIAQMRARAGRVKNKVDFLEDGHSGQAFGTFVCGGHAETRCPGQAVRGRINADHRAHLDVLAVAHDLDHQIGTDVSTADDGSLEFAGHTELQILLRHMLVRGGGAFAY